MRLENRRKRQRGQGKHAGCQQPSSLWRPRRAQADGLAFPEAPAVRRAERPLAVAPGGGARSRKSRAVTAAGVGPASRPRQLGALSVGGAAAAMAVDTLSPDWEFDRVDDGSQSESLGVGRGGPGGAAEGRRTAPGGAAARWGLSRGVGRGAA